MRIRVLTATLVPVLFALSNLPVHAGDAPNSAPIAVAGGDQHLTATGCAARVRLDGTGSSDPDGDPLRYMWWTDYAAAIGPVVEMDLPPGTHTIELVVSDAQGGTASDTLVVT